MVVIQQETVYQSVARAGFTYKGNLCAILQLICIYRGAAERVSCSSRLERNVVSKSRNISKVSKVDQICRGAHPSYLLLESLLSRDALKDACLLLEQTTAKSFMEQI